MSKYNVTCYARKVGAIGSHGTERVTVTVTAANVIEAREKAIDEVYKWRTDLEHVNPRNVYLLSKQEDEHGQT